MKKFGKILLALFAFAVFVVPVFAFSGCAEAESRQSGTLTSSISSITIKQDSSKEDLFGTGKIVLTYDPNDGDVITIDTYAKFLENGGAITGFNSKILGSTGTLVIKVMETNTVEVTYTVS